MPLIGFSFPIVAKKQEGNNVLFRFGTDNVAGIYAYCSEPLPTPAELVMALMYNPGIVRQYFATDQYRERKERNKFTQSRTIVDLRKKKLTPPTIEPVPVIKLGGEFLQIGGDNENAGGGYQKLG